MIENDLRANGLRNRFWSYLGDRLRRYGGLDYETSSPGLDPETRKNERLTEYAVRWAYYENKRLYHFLKACGLCSRTMPTEYNPVPATVAFYVTNVLPGELAVTGIAPEGQQPNDANLIAAVNQIWEWTNFEVFKQNLTETAAVASDVFVKVAERVAEGEDGEAGDGPAVTGVYLQEVAPESVRYYTADERGYLTSIRIDTPRFESILGGRDREHTLIEIWRKAWGEDEGGVRFYETEGRATVKDANLPDALRAETFSQLEYNFIPIVWISVTTHWWFMTDQIDRYNRLALRAFNFNRPHGIVQGKHTDSAGRPLPAAKLDRSEFKAMLGSGESDEPSIMEVPALSEFYWATSPIDMASHMARMEQLKEHIEESLPEYLVATLKITQVATETLQIALNQAGQRVLDMRGDLERGLVRAQMMALTVAQKAGLPLFAREQIGEYETGGLKHKFKPRDVFKLPVTVMADVVQKLAPSGMPIKLILRAAQFDEAFLADLDQEAAAQAAREQTTLASALLQAQARVDSGAADNGVTRPGSPAVANGNAV